MQSPCVLHAHAGLHLQSQQVVPIVSLQRPSNAVAQLRHSPKCHLQQSKSAGPAHKRSLLVTAAAGLDEGLSTSSSLLGPSTQPQQKGNNVEPPGSVEGVELASEVTPSSVGLCLRYCCACPLYATYFACVTRLTWTIPTCGTLFSKGTFSLLMT